MYMQRETQRMWGEWTVATLAGYAVGILAILPGVVGLAYAAQPEMLIGLVSGAVIGGALGIAQWLVLRRYTEVPFWWILACIVGSMIGLSIGMALGDSLALPAVRAATREAAASTLPWRVVLQAGLSGLLLGVMLGAAQWLVLRSALRSANWWILASGLGWMLGLGLGAAIAEFSNVLIAVLLTGAIGGAITGWALQQLRWQTPGQGGVIARPL
ncbi:MAG: hypothetical protein IT328_17950 [Caldilineaceae bacterium]|nr:hypothetical protein [Caldilineaceae bacterium]